MRLVTKSNASPVWHLVWCLPLILGSGFGLNALLQAAPRVASVADAAKADDLAAVRNLIKDHADVNAVANDGSTALLWAAYRGDVDMTKALIAAGANVDAENHYGVTPLLQACRSGNVEVIKALLDAGADATKWHAEGETPLMAASRTGSVEAVKMLLAHGAFVNATDPNQEETALMWAASEGQLDVVKTLLAAGADVNVKAHVSLLTDRKNSDHPSGGMTALMFAVRDGHEDVVKALVAGGADLKATDADGATAAVIAVVNDRFDLAKELVDMGSDPNDGVLYWAVDMHDATTDMHPHDGSRMVPTHENKMTSLDLVKALLDVGADPNKPFQGALHSTTLCCGAFVNASPLYRAAQAADVDVLKLLIAKGGKVDWSPTEIKPKAGEKGPGRGANAGVGKTPIMAAMAGGLGAPFGGGPGFSRVTAPPYREPGVRDPAQAVQLLLKAGADPNLKAPDGTTALHQAVTQQQVELIKELVAGGAKLDAVDKKGQTPLMAADKMKNVTYADIAAMAMTDPDAWHRTRNSKDEVVAALREAMHLGPNDPIPVPPKEVKEVKDDKKVEAKADGDKPAGRPGRAGAAGAAAAEKGAADTEKATETAAAASE